MSSTRSRIEGYLDENENRQKLVDSQCTSKGESVTYIVSVYSMLARKEFKQKRNNLSRILNWELCRKLGLDHTDNWYEYKLDKILENKNYKVL